MKTVILLTIAALMSTASISFAQNSPSKEMVVGVSDAFVPGGFDSNSDAYVVTSGVFPNGCYSWNRATVNSKDEYTHDIRAIANVSSGMCIMVFVPFTKEVRLGKLATGAHTLRFVGGDGTYLEKKLVVE
jgi:hypothetical protein